MDSRDFNGSSDDFRGKEKSPLPREVTEQDKSSDAQRPMVGKGTSNRDPEIVVKRPAYLADLRNSKGGKRLDVSRMKKPRISGLVSEQEIPVVSAEDLRDPRWAAPGQKGVGMLLPTKNGEGEAELIGSPSHSRKKHQVNWLAQVARRNDAELLEKAAAGKQKQRSTAMKYGW